MKFSYSELKTEAYHLKTSILRLIFDKYVYNILPKNEFEMIVRPDYNRRPVVIQDKGFGCIEVMVYKDY